MPGMTSLISVVFNELGYNTKLGAFDQLRRFRKGKHADEQAHREADAAQNGQTVDLAPGRAAGALGDAKLHRQLDRRKYAQLLAQEQAGGNAKRKWFQQRSRPKTRQRNARIGETK
jgi:hypothetical protein